MLELVLKRIAKRKGYTIGLEKLKQKIEEARNKGEPVRITVM